MTPLPPPSPNTIGGDFQICICPDGDCVLEAWPTPAAHLCVLLHLVGTTPAAPLCVLLHLVGTTPAAPLCVLLHHVGTTPAAPLCGKRSEARSRTRWDQLHFKPHKHLTIPYMGILV